MMCAQHALNAILQDSYFDPAQLAQIAEEIQGYERGELGVSTSQAESSQHMDETGFFSVEVIDRALRAWDMQLVRWRNCNALRDRYPHPEREFAFLLNFGSHWLALRGFGHQSRVWYNLNSFFEAPQWVSDTYLATFLLEAEREKYSVFAVEPCAGIAPPATLADDMFDMVAQESGPAGEGRANVSTHGSAESVGDDDADEDLQAAIRASLADPVSRASGASAVEQGATPNGIAHSSPAPSGAKARRRSPDSDLVQQATGIAAPVRRSRRRVSHSASQLNEDELVYASSARRSPFLMPEASASMLVPDEEIEELSESSSVGSLDAAGAKRFESVHHEHADDRELQAAIAASLGYDLSEPTASEALSLPDNFARSRDPTPEPEDVKRIRQIRAQKSADHNSSAAPAQPGPQRTDNDGQVAPPEDGVGGASSEPLGEELAPEEIRRRRLARFG